jgi:hypothetical protein
MHGLKQIFLHFKKLRRTQKLTEIVLYTQEDKSHSHTDCKTLEEWTVGRSSECCDASASASTGSGDDSKLSVNVSDGVVDSASVLIAQPATRSAARPSRTCSACGRTAKDLGLRHLLTCGGCTIAPLYCGVACQRACWKAHTRECRENMLDID